MIFKRRLACSFCGKGDEEVAKLVAGPKVYICDACAAIANRIMQEEDSGDSHARQARPGILRRIWNRTRRWITWKVFRSVEGRITQPV